MTLEATPEETAASLIRANKPTLVVEGADDKEVYRALESFLDPTKVAIEICYGRPQLIKIWTLVTASGKSPPVAFLADQDLYVFSGVPSHYSGIIFTNGYSIENDLYSSGLEALLSQSEKVVHQLFLDSVVCWFAGVMERTLAGEEGLVWRTNVKQMLRHSQALDPQFVRDAQHKPASLAFEQHVRRQYQTHLRGKQLIQTLALVTNAPDRATKYNERQLTDLAVKIIHASTFTMLCSKIRNVLHI